MWLRLTLVSGAAILAGSSLPDPGPDASPAVEVLATSPESASSEPPPTPREIPTTTHMHAKLTATQHVLAGLLREDFRQIEESARQLRDIAESVPVQASSIAADDRVYEHFRLEFARLASDLERVAAARNLEGAAYVHGNLTATCIGCHQRLRATPSEIQLMHHQP
jgi:cytochrome c556